MPSAPLIVPGMGAFQLTSDTLFPFAIASKALQPKVVPANGSPVLPAVVFIFAPAQLTLKIGSVATLSPTWNNVKFRLSHIVNAVRWICFLCVNDLSLV